MNSSQKKAASLLNMNVLALSAILLFPTCASATEVIKQFDVNAEISKDLPKLDVNESITIDFGNQPRHGLLRIYNPDQQVSIISTVDQSGKKCETNISQKDNKTQLRIGSPSTTVTGTHKYIIHYTIQNAIKSDGTLNWSPTGHNWEQKIEKFKMRLVATNPASKAVHKQSEPQAKNLYHYFDAKSGGVFLVNASNIRPGQGIDVIAELAPSYKHTVPATSSTASRAAEIASPVSPAMTAFTFGAIFVAFVAVILALQGIARAANPRGLNRSGSNDDWHYESGSSNNVLLSCSSASSCGSSSSSCSSSSSSCSSSSCGGGGSW